MTSGLTTRGILRPQNLLILMVRQDLALILFVYMTNLDILGALKNNIFLTTTRSGAFIMPPVVTD